MRHLVMPRLAARAQLRRHAMKLGYWRRGDAMVADLEYEPVADDLFVVTTTDGFGLADAFRVVFCEEPNPEPEGTVWVLSVMTSDEPLSAATFEILRARRTVARERSNSWFPGRSD
jgi:hypothetical protein